MSHDTIERWLPVVGWEGLYEVSDHGRVRSVDRLEVTKAGYTRQRRGKVLSPRQNRGGYMVVSLSREGKHRTPKVHRLVLEAFVGPCPRGHETRHMDGNPGNNRLDNLRWGTSSQNALDRVTHGTHRNARKTHCPRGHLLEAPNLVPSALKHGWRKCLACARAHDRVRCRPELRPDFEQIADDYYRALMSPDG